MENRRRAVVVIHGIGEQQPMAVLRGLLKGLGIEEFFKNP